MLFLYIKKEINFYGVYALSNEALSGLIPVRKSKHAVFLTRPFSCVLRASNDVSGE